MLWEQISGAYAGILKRGFHCSKVTVILDYLTALLEYLDLFTKIIIQYNDISVANYQVSCFMIDPDSGSLKFNVSSSV